MMIRRRSAVSGPLSEVASVRRVTVGVPTAAVVLTVGGPTPAVAAVAPPTVTDLGTLPGFEASEAYVINDQGPADQATRSVSRAG
jgi:hypothetical protein